MTRGPAAALLALALAFGAVSCSDDDTDDAGSSTTTVTGGVTTTSAAPADASSTVVDDATTTTTVSPAEPGATTTTTSTGPTTSALAGPVTTTTAAGGGATPSSLPPASIGVPEEPSLNEDGEPITLDETALLACANDQFAWVSFQQGDTETARAELAAAAQRAEVSAVPSVSDFADDLAGALDADDPLAVMQSFLDLCAANGFEY